MLHIPKVNKQSLQPQIISKNICKAPETETWFHKNIHQIMWLFSGMSCCVGHAACHQNQGS